MRYSITFCEQDYIALTAHLFRNSSIENAAYLLCRTASSNQETRLLVREVLPVREDEIDEASGRHMSIPSHSFLRAMKLAHQKKECFVFVHSHPPDVPRHSEQDDQEEKKLFHTAYNRIDNAIIHASLVFSSPHAPIGRAWLPDGTTAPMDVVRVIGNRFQFFYSDPSRAVPQAQFFDRQIRAFGPDLQRLLNRLVIGVIGTGGTGSCVIEQLIRLGVGTLIAIDGQRFEESNVSRRYGSRVSDSGTYKVAITERNVNEIGLGTRLIAVAKNITFLSAFQHLMDCDLVFGCTDDQWGRSLLTRLTIYYFIPVFDVGVRLDSNDGVMRSVQGRVTTLLPGAACLFCRNRITPEGVRAESLEVLNPAEAERLRKEGYAPELQTPAPAVITFTTSVAAGAVSELLHRLTGFQGSDRNSTEVLFLFDQTRVRTNNLSPKPDCFCGDRSYWGRGDRNPLIDTLWRTE